MIAFDIPIPPSVNAMFANVAKVGRVKTRAYVNWLTEAGYRLNTAHPGKIQGAYSAEIQLPAAMRGDVDGRIKAVLDLLVRHGITPDDRHCQRVTAARVSGLTEARVIVTELSA